MSGVLLDKPSKRRAATRRGLRSLWLPPSAQPIERCTICDHPFFEGEERAFVAHVRACGQEYAATESPSVKAGALFEHDDPELLEYVTGRGKARILSGRESMPNG